MGGPWLDSIRSAALKVSTVAMGWSVATGLLLGLNETQHFSSCTLCQRFASRLLATSVRPAECLSSSIPLVIASQEGGVLSTERVGDISEADCGRSSRSWVWSRPRLHADVSDYCRCVLERGAHRKVIGVRMGASERLCRLCRSEDASHTCLVLS